MKQTNYSELRNLLLVVSFNQPAGEIGTKVQPIVIEAHGEAWTPENAVRNVINRVNIGKVIDTELTEEELYKAVYGLSPVLAEVLQGVLMEGVAKDVSTVDVSGVKPTGVSDIIPKVV